MTTPQIASYVTTYASRTPYLTPNDWLNAPTAVDASDLVEDGTGAMQREVLAERILAASSFIDEMCQQVLAATVDTDRRRLLVNQYGRVRMPLRRKPVLEVSAVSVGSSPNQMTPLLDLGDVEIGQGGVIEIPVTASMGSRPIVNVTYVNGWPHTLLAADADANDASIDLQAVTGIYPGTTMTIYDADSTEVVQVAPDYVLGALTVPLVAPLANGHAAEVAVSALPPKVREAAILLTTALIQTRGNDAIVLASLNEPSQLSNEGGTAASNNVALAMTMIASLRRAW